MQKKNIISIAAASTLALLAATDLASAGDRRETNLGPVGPYQPILAKVGTSRLLAYYEPTDGKCALSAVVFDQSDKNAKEDSTQVRVALHPGEQFNLAGANGERIVLACAPNAKGMTVLNQGELRTKSASNALY